MNENLLLERARIDDCRAIAELAQLAGDGIPGYFWKAAAKQGQTLIDVGANNAASHDDNFSYRNAHIARVADATAGMLLAYRLPDESDNDVDLDEYPDFIRPLIELEQCVPTSYYINMLATYPQFRGSGIGTRLMGLADQLADSAGCALASLVVFSENTRAFKLYRQLGYRLSEQRSMPAFELFPNGGEALLLIKSI